MWVWVYEWPKHNCVYMDVYVHGYVCVWVRLILVCTVRKPNCRQLRRKHAQIKEIHQQHQSIGKQADRQASR